jgi:hypothetical protein
LDWINNIDKVISLRYLFKGRCHSNPSHPPGKTNIAYKILKLEMEDGKGGLIAGGGEGGIAKKGSIECKETRPRDLDQ